jgi:hypothetical protein
MSGTLGDQAVAKARARHGWSKSNNRRYKPSILTGVDADLVKLRIDAYYEKDEAVQKELLIRIAEIQEEQKND